MPDELFFSVVVDKMKGNFASNAGKAVAGKGFGGKLVGMFIGKAGEDYFKRALRTVNSLFKEVLIKIAQHVSDNPGARLNQEQIDGLAKHVQKQLAPVRTGALSNERCKLIVQEVAARERWEPLPVPGSQATLWAGPP